MVSEMQMLSEDFFCVLGGEVVASRALASDCEGPLDDGGRCLFDAGCEVFEGRKGKVIEEFSCAEDASASVSEKAEAFWS